jgi:hypothetical protein
MMARKFLAGGARGPFSGVAWPRPTQATPGAWIVVDAELAQCVRGVHVCRNADLAYWIHDELWDVEVDGAAIEGVDCLVVARARLLRRIEAWTEGRRQFAQASIEHAAASVGAAGNDAVRELLDDAQVVAKCGYPALAAYSAAVAVARGSGDDVVQRFREERAWQSVWIAEYVGRG